MRFDVKKYITDIAVVAPDKLLISNIQTHYYWGVQLVVNRKGKLLREEQLQITPGRLCLTDRNTVAMLMEADEIQMIQVKDKTLTLGTVVTVGKHVCGITSSGNTLVVSYKKKPWLEKVSMDGTVLNQFDIRGNPKHFVSPFFMCTTPDGSVFISDNGTNNITQVDESLNLLQTFTSPLLMKPYGITALTEDQILVCSQGNDSIVLLQPSTNTVTTLLGKEDEICSPYSLTHCADQRKLYVTSYCTDTIKVYQTV